MEANNQTEKERLELLDKKIEIQRKRVDIIREKASIKEIEDRKQLAIDQQRILIEKTAELRYLLSEWTIDNERTILGSEPFLKPILDIKEKEMVIKKLMDIVSKF